MPKNLCCWFNAQQHSLLDLRAISSFQFDCCLSFLIKNNSDDHDKIIMIINTAATSATRNGQVIRNVRCYSDTKWSDTNLHAAISKLDLSSDTSHLSPVLPFLPLHVSVSEKQLGLIILDVRKAKHIL